MITGLNPNIIPVRICHKKFRILHSYPLSPAVSPGSSTRRCSTGMPWAATGTGPYAVVQEFLRQDLKAVSGCVRRIIFRKILFIYFHPPPPYPYISASLNFPHGTISTDLQMGDGENYQTVGGLPPTTECGQPAPIRSDDEPGTGTCECWVLSMLL